MVQRSITLGHVHSVGKIINSYNNRRVEKTDRRVVTHTRLEEKEKVGKYQDLERERSDEFGESEKLK